MTERQRTCYSLKNEHGWPIAQIARHEGIDRATVREHIDTAQKKIEHALQNDRNRARRASHSNLE